MISEESENVKETSDSGDFNLIKSSSHQSEENPAQDIPIDISKEVRESYGRKDSGYSKGKRSKKRPSSSIKNGGVSSTN